MCTEKTGGASGARPADGSKAEAAPTAAADTAAGQPPMAKRLSTNPAEKEDSTVKNELWKWRNGGKRGNPKAGFPLFPPFLGNLANNARFPHFHSSGGSRRMEKWKTKSRFPTFPPPRIPFLPEANPGRGRASPSARRRAPCAALRIKEELSFIVRNSFRQVEEMVDARQPTASAKQRPLLSRQPSGHFL